MSFVRQESSEEPVAIFRAQHLEISGSSAELIPIYQTTWYYIPEDLNLNIIIFPSYLKCQ
jgi:hypothetical protein